MGSKSESNYDNDIQDTAQAYPRPKPRPMPRFEVTDDIVISGIAGRFPESDNIDEFADNLFNNVDMVTCDDRRWPTDLHNGVISRAGKLKELDKFDCSFFSTLTFFADAMDVQSRVMLESTYEAICDAGVNPQIIRGTNTGVYVGFNTTAFSDDIPQNDFQDSLKREALLNIYGTVKSLYANRISFLFDFHGPSNLIDTACSSSLVALVYALNDIRNGVCDQAVVATANLIQSPYSNLIFSAGNMQSADGKCKVWDKKADGFVRSETVGSIFLQKKSDAKRIYATVLHAKTNTDGFKPLGFFCPFWVRQRDLMMSTFQEAGVDPNDVKYLEFHGTGTRVGDPQESKAVADAYYSEQRVEPLLVGSVKSNMGHSEGSSGFSGLAKAIITFENQCIPANLHFEESNPEIDAIVKGILLPVVKNTPFDNNIIGVNSFGIGGVNAHVLLKANNKQLSEDMSKIAQIIPRLVNVCGRTEESVKYIFDFIENNPNKINQEFLALLTDVMKSITVKGSSNFPYRGHMIIKQKINEQNLAQYEYSRTQTADKNKQSVWLVFTGMGSQWTAMAKTLMPIKVFANSIKRSATVLKPYNIDLMHLLLSDDQNVLNKKITNPFVALTSMQIALYDVISLLNLKIVGIIGHSFGEIACAYVDGCLTQEQAVLTAYWRGKVVENANECGELPRGMLAAVGLSWQEIKKRCPDGIVAACHNGSDSVTISGLHDNMVNFLEQLNSENIFAQPIPGGGFPYHSKVMNIVAPQLLHALNGVIPKPKQRSDKWICTSFPPEEWHQEMAKYASGQYFTNNLVSPVYFSEAMSKIEKDSLVIEVAPHSYFEAIFKSCYSNLIYTSLMKRTESDNLNYILSSIGTLYSYGLNPDIENLYPRIEWPVSRGTQSISSLIKWDHERINEVKKYPEYHNFSTASDFKMKFSLLDPDWYFLKDHAIDGKILFPATGYIFMVWRRMAAVRDQPWMKTPVAFENVRFFRASFLSESNTITFTIRILVGTGDFTVTERSAIVCTGKVYIPDEKTLESQNEIDEFVNEEYEEIDMLSSKDIYKELRIRGYDYGPKFQGLVEARSDGMSGKVKWTGHVISFLDSVLHLAAIASPQRAFFVPIGVQSIRIDPNILFEALETTRPENERENTDLFQIQAEKQFFGVNELTAVVKDIQLSDDNRQTINAIISQSDDNTTKRIGGTVCEKQEIKDNDTHVKEYEVTALPIVLNRNMRSLITRGIEISGVKPANIPRITEQKTLILEKYVFIPNCEHQAIDIEFKEEIIRYIEVCCSLIERLSTLTGKIKKPTLNGYKCADESTIKRYSNSTKDCYKILNLFTKLIDSMCVDSNDNFVKEDINSADMDNTIIKDVINKENNIEYDILKTVVTNERFFRPLLDIVIENSLDRENFKVLELNATNSILVESIKNLLSKSCADLINVDYCLVTPSPNSVPEVIKSLDIKIFEWDINEKFMPKDISSSIDLLIYRPNIEVCKHISIDEQIKALTVALKDYGFILLMTRNNMTPPEVTVNELYNNDSNKEILLNKQLDQFIEIGEKYNLKVVAKKSDSLTSTLVLLRKIKTETIETEIINITKGKYEQWVNVLKEKVENNRNANEKKNAWLVANDTTVNGVIGLANCLGKESGGRFVRCLFDYDNKLPLPVDFTQSPYDEVIKMDLTTNIYKDSEWGTYRYISISEEHETIMTEHAYLNIASAGDMSSLKWFDAQHKYFSSLALNEKNEQQVLINMYYSPINFKDVVLASGWIQKEPESAIFDCVIGWEFAGRRADNGKRVMGMIPFKGIATTLIANKDHLLYVPDEWTLEEAATIPLVYLTIYYALIVKGNLCEKESVLIHSGAGGVGQAAINICQSLNCEIFVTVGNQEKREFIKNTFNIDDTHIGNSRDTSFEKQIMTATQGKGVDIVLNSLTEDKLQASVRCLAMNGRFLEIGKYDMQMNKNLSMSAFLKNISFHGVGLDCIFTDQTLFKKFDDFMKRMIKYLNDGIAKNVVKPIVRTVFDMNEYEQAFRYMTTGKHIGKVLIKIRDEESERIVVSTKQLLVNATTKTWFHPTKVYIIIGGLGGFGLELAYWMALRGAKRLVLTSRTGIKNAYQKWILNQFKKLEMFGDFKVEINVTTNDAITIESANQLIDEANRMGSVGGIFNLALVLNDALFENQTVENFRTVCAPKLDLLSNLDKVSQEKCPQLDYFVCLSSITAGRGNAGQTNYGYANSAMERICELRRNNGLHGLAVQFGPIGDVGVVAEQLIDTVFSGDALKLFGGVMLQRISSCLAVLDRYLQTTFPVLSSYEKQTLESGHTNSEDQLFRQLCLQFDIDNRSDCEKLDDIGLDSMMAVEIQQKIERAYDINLTIAQIRKLTVAEFKKFRDLSKDELKHYSNDLKKVKINLLSIRWDIADETYTHLNSIKTGKPLFVLPPLQAIFDNFKELLAKINRPVIGINWTKQLNEIQDFKKICAYYKECIKNYSTDDSKSGYDMIGHSFGAVIAFHLFRKRMPIKTMILLDSTNISTNMSLIEETDKFAILFAYFRLLIPERIVNKMHKQVMEIKVEEERVTKMIELIKEYSDNQLIGKDFDQIIRSSFVRADMMFKYMSKNRDKLLSTKPDYVKKRIMKKMFKEYNTDITVIKLLETMKDFDAIENKIQENFGFTKEQFDGTLTVHPIIGTESQFLTTNAHKMSQIINQKLE